jgi:hypothetical protein
LVQGDVAWDKLAALELVVVDVVVELDLPPGAVVAEMSPRDDASSY